MTHRMTYLVVELALILFAAHGAGHLARRYKLPGVMGEIGAGILIGPHLLGSLPLPLLPRGLFPLHAGEIPVSPELYGLATIASIILLFLSGLETDIKMFLRFALKGSLVGMGGLAMAFGAGYALTAIWLGGAWLSPQALFLGLLCVPTSVGITARVLSEHRKIDSPEGVTILAAAVIDDVLGIILVAVIVGLAGVLTVPGAESFQWKTVSTIAAQAFGMWIGFTLAGILLSRQISRVLKLVKAPSQIAVLAFGLALLLAGIFEAAGLAMIIGAYVMGLSLSNTDINYLLQEQMEPLQRFFVPIFFVVMGMLVDLRAFASPQVIGFGLVYALAGGVAAKLLGSALPARLLGFTNLGSLRVGIGMVPRGEVVLIIAGIGIGSGILSQELFGVAVLMTLISTVVAPPLLEKTLKHPARGTTFEPPRDDSVITRFDFGSNRISTMLTAEILKTLGDEGFFIHLGSHREQLYQIRKDSVFMILQAVSRGIHFTSPKKDVTFINNLVYESIVNLQYTVTRLKNFSAPPELRTQRVEESSPMTFEWNRYLALPAISLNLTATTKDGIIRELLDLLEQEHPLEKRKIVEKDVLARESIMSTGMQEGVAIPHARTSGTSRLRLALGLAPEGVDFQALDGKPSRIFFLLVSPDHESSPHLQVLAAISGALHKEEARKQLLASRSAREVMQALLESSQRGRA
ncbi:cation:proton antiporter domain-containing protein [Alkalispirochaeta alkalica]|uniref:cation:proton antiporter domain-containing protein n=1 Tax=Alkalispirochaeta alkalica TaxID=46356 RepID=UPI0003A29B5A|nr:cation:proton antiporter [Alkalispirochaeta alkalica]